MAKLAMNLTIYSISQIRLADKIKDKIKKEEAPDACARMPLMVLWLFGSGKTEKPGESAPRAGGVVEGKTPLSVVAVKQSNETELLRIHPDIVRINDPAHFTRRGFIRDSILPSNRGHMLPANRI